MKKRLLTLLTSTLCLSLYADAAVDEVQDAPDLVAAAKVDIYALTRADSLPEGEYEEMTDTYLEGYIQALVDMHYYEQRVRVIVKDHHVYLSNLPHNDLLSNSILAFVSGVPGVKSVEVKEPSKAELEQSKKLTEPRVGGVWFPQSTVLYPPMIADPREPMYYVAYRGADKVVGKVAAAVAMGDDFPLFRWRDVFRWHGDLQIGIQAGIWAVFNYQDVPHKSNHETSELINTDYLVGIPLSYAADRWAFRARIYHISSHLGDEFLVNHPSFLHKRKNPSFEAIDFFTSYQFSKDFRGYFGPGVIVHSDDSFPMKTFYVEYGMELRLFGKKLDYHRLYGTPFLAIHLENWQVRNWSLDTTIKAGYELSKLQGVGRKMRIYADYHQGFSYEGQFFKKRVKYYEIGLSWGW
ncbi:MAG: DUF1207 domain-containing protein [Chlamydiales bacterium]|nr:DUF1207 domain-containing protein [Chlamydiales bacterium]